MKNMSREKIFAAIKLSCVFSPALVNEMFHNRRRASVTTMVPNKGPLNMKQHFWIKNTSLDAAVKHTMDVVNDSSVWNLFRDIIRSSFDAGCVCR